MLSKSIFFFFFFNDTATTEIYTLSLHDALPIYFRRELLGVLRDVRVQINRRRMLVKFALLVARRDDVRMAMPHADRHDAAETVEITFARIVPDILHRALDEHERFFVIEKNAGGHELL